MADEAFALSPISARAAEPREEDYDAISVAFMETSRGRWFLGEYAKRNRNADTRMVLDAVARIENSIAAQKQVPSDNSLADNRLAETLTAIRAAVDSARSAAFEALGDVALEDKLTPLRKGARIIHEIAWRWREIGADGRICDLLSAQVSAIEASCVEITALDARTALGAAFELVQRNIEDNIAGLAGGGDLNSPVSAGPNAEASPAPSPVPPKPVEASGETTAAPMAETGDTGLAEPASDASVETASIRDSIDDDGYDEAILDVVALEMAIADPVEPERVNAATEFAAPAVHVTAKFDETNDVEIHFAGSPEETAAAKPASVAQPIVTNPAAVSAMEMPGELSLGSSLIANGIIKKPGKAPATDPMAAIRRLSQVEKIALFS